MKDRMRHSWPGNVRELQNVIERSVILLTSAVLSGSLQELPHPTQDGSKWSKRSMPVTPLDGQISHILQTLQETKGVIGGRNGAAVRLGLGPDDVDLQNEAAGYHSMVTETWSGYLKGLL
jgi:formate hydrogenlyase transcriptional activator